MTSAFMTWSGTGWDDIAPLNLELPSVTLRAFGLKARLEFNWMDDLQRTWREAREKHEIRRGNPLAIVIDRCNLRLADLLPVVHHTTHRQKYGFYGADGRERLVVNIDLMVAQSVATRRIAESWDVDISSVRPIDTPELSLLRDFSSALVERFDLVPATRTKVLADVLALGLIPGSRSSDGGGDEIEK